MNKAKILVVEDDKAVRNLITTTLETQNYQYHTAEKGSEALLEAVSFQPDVMLLDRSEMPNCFIISSTGLMPSSRAHERQ